MVTVTTRLSWRKVLGWTIISTMAAIVLGVLIWQGVTAKGSPDPLTEGISPSAAVMNAAILVFREGLEAILVLAALTASLVRTRENFWKPVALGAGCSFAASFVTWFIVVALISSINASALHVQAATGVLAIVVLLIIMNWFFHEIYWAGWIGLHNRRKKNLLASAEQSKGVLCKGLFLLGFTAVYREGFEVVLFLQSIRLRAGDAVIIEGTSIGIALTVVVAILTWVGHYRLPYKKMLVLTGGMLGVVLLVMVGESVQELQLAKWISVTQLNISMPEWLNTWFAVFPTVESLASQVVAASLVIGSYFLARRSVTRVSKVTSANNRRPDTTLSSATCELGQQSICVMTIVD